MRSVLSDALADHKRWMVKDILNRLSPPPAKRTLQDDLALLRSLGMVESTGRRAGARWSLKRGMDTVNE